ncbi:helix-turn-helix domain-containing protein [Alicyclobacillus cycloheptanicus]|uniref:SOS-response transcriptional repressor LexA n=1 Tax=Alicyclobacillus cycloheptanicus TaxID=1457 RepID=A0ABT9XLE5_9BACL|nr:helix-turn-helix domain-containing protein [Alicyclobacillus cycloheptanicus]MDQ0191127.1 SOS-response transcriptional repressor LexA [Alicyclobacillus cycloheptanicus]WDM01870.1 helix-turn-helix domain-containing protein [Alicyclobacillus cycloheptanicus]
MTLGQRLREARKKMGWSQTYVSQITGISNTNISNYERDFRRPDMETLTKLASLYHQSLDYLITGNNDDLLQSTLFESNSQAIMGNFEGRVHDAKFTTPLVMVPILRNPSQSERTSELVDEFIPVLASELDMVKYEYFWFKVQDDSMSGEGITKGALVLVRSHLNDLDKHIDGSLRIVKLGDKYTIRRVYETTMVIALEAANPSYPLKLIHNRIELDEYGMPVPIGAVGRYGEGEVVRVMHNCLPM